MMKRKRYVIIIAVLAAIFSVSTFFLIRNHIDSKKQAEIYDELIETVEDTDETQETMSYSEDQSFLPDYQELFLQNNDMVGWIKVEDTKINYPVMQSKEEPNFYLQHGFDKLSKDRIYVNVIMSDDLEEMKHFRDFLAKHHITNVAADSYTLDWDAKIISITAYPETKAESRLINDYIARSSTKFKRVVQPT